jgi:hypothetical protein
MNVSLSEALEPDEKWNQEMIMPYKKGKDINVMI